ncbi:MAG: hypothetical protein AAFP90_19505 [Planctomycetota bacterium]
MKDKLIFACTMLVVLFGHAVAFAQFESFNPPAAPKTAAKAFTGEDCETALRALNKRLTLLESTALDETTVREIANEEIDKRLEELRAVIQSPSGGQRLAAVQPAQGTAIQPAGRIQSLTIDGLTGNVLLQPGERIVSVRDTRNHTFYDPLIQSVPTSPVPQSIQYRQQPRRLFRRRASASEYSQCVNGNCP